jgi:secreted trypsin-like serine protease
MKRCLVAVLAAIAVTATPAAAVTGNYEQDNQHPYVGLIAFYDGNGDFMWRCSGSLIAPRVFLTAGHCTDQDAAVSPSSARVWFEQGAGAHFDGIEDPVTGYPEECLDATMCATSDRLFDYGYDDFAGAPNTHDLGLVILDRTVSGVTEYGRLAPAGFLDSLAARQGLQDTTLTVSGYGYSQTSRNNPKKTISLRERLMAETRLVNLTSALTDGYNIQVSSAPANGRGGTCFGDSGGPLFSGPFQSNTIVAVDSFLLNGNCRGTGFEYRTDRADVLAWIQETVAANP